MRQSLLSLILSIFLFTTVTGCGSGGPGVSSEASAPWSASTGAQGDSVAKTSEASTSSAWVEDDAVRSSAANLKAAEAPAPAAPSGSCPRLGITLEPVGSVAVAWPFVDCFRLSSPWCARTATGQPWTGAPLALTSDGWVASLLPGQVADTTVLSRQGGNYPSGQYTCLWDGSGTLQFLGDARLVSQTPGRAVVQVTPTAGGQAGIRLTSTSAGNPVRNIRFIMPGFEATCATQPFHPTFTKSLATFRVIRFLNWMRTNDSPLTTWAQRTTLASASQAGPMGVAPELIADLCNQLGADAWICIPHQADDAYVTGLATLLRDRLNPALRVHIEYSNEIWGTFTQSSWARQQGMSLGLASDPTTAGLRFQARRSVEIFDIFEKVFAGRSRLVRVLAASHANPSTGMTVMTWSNAWQKADALATAPYFGGNLGTPQNAPATVKMTVAQVLTALDAENQKCHAFTATNAANAARYGLSYVSYEGGQALYGQGSWQGDAALGNLFAAVNRSSGMRALYLTHCQRWKSNGGSLQVVFSHTGSYGAAGCWGLLEKQAQDPATAYKLQGLLDWAATGP